ncbi:hypothetical protein MYAER_0677 [Microcystis aeruginosa NIES-2549]|uniref:Uncharacterized protein n=1 Tax=Microcystis aeruginosa NIES-2549 TaxID=1641812 RepID=A0A0F6U215_MICAE|nr:hypothetical protein MYAER_0677 [Microcystis aeruginosa NIES-2549]AOC51431.1 hypothetical protein amyaer_0682 [Microcystis aeruginosa NIES-2481]
MFTEKAPHTPHPTPHTLHPSPFSLLPNPYFPSKLLYRDGLGKYE